MTNATFVVLLSSLLMGTSFLQELPPSPEDAKLAKSEPTSYMSSHPLLTGAAALRGGGCNNNNNRGGLQQLPEDDGEPFGGGRPRRRQPPHQGYPPNGYDEECQVRFGLHYSSCFAKYKDFDDKFDQLQHHVPSLPRGGARDGDHHNHHSPCSTLQLLAKVKSSPLFDRCNGNQYLVRTPYHMYNVKGELRYIVQDPPHLEQCYLEASCSVPSEVCRSYGYGRRCEARHCHHTLLAWDPANPDAGTFFDVFEYACCCNCAAPAGRSTQLGG